MLSPHQERELCSLEPMMPFLQGQLHCKQLVVPNVIISLGWKEKKVQRWSFTSEAALCDRTTPTPTSEASTYQNDLERIQKVASASGNHKKFFLTLVKAVRGAATEL